MGAYAWAKLEIGGRADRQTLIDALLDHTDLTEEAIEEALTDLKAGLSGGAVDACCVYVEDGHLVVEDPEASYAQFTDLEAALQRLRVPFDRTSEDVAEFDGAFTQYRPEIGQVDTAHNDGQSVVPLDEVRAKLSEGPEALRAWLDTTYPVVPLLPPLVVEEDEPLEVADK